VPDWPIPYGQIQRKAMSSHRPEESCDCTIGADELLGGQTVCSVH
jgi:hypothetical protein